MPDPTPTTTTLLLDCPQPGKPMPRPGAVVFHCSGQITADARRRSALQAERESAAKIAATLIRRIQP